MRGYRLKLPAAVFFLTSCNLGIMEWAYPADLKSFNVAHEDDAVMHSVT